MKRTALAVIAGVGLALAGTAQAKGGSHGVKGYTKKDGTYVAPHHQTDPNKSKRDNYSSKGNVNPNNGKEGTKDPDKQK